MHNENWDDLRYVLTVAKTGSVLRAAKELGVNHATVLRHVAAFEERHGTKVFEKTARGYRLLQGRAHIIEAAREAQTAMREVGRLASGGQVNAKLAIKIASTDTLCALILPQFVANLRAAHPDVHVTLVSSNFPINLMQEQADIVVRPALALSDEFVGKRVVNLHFGAYATHPDATRWLALAGPLSRSVAARWIADRVRDQDMFLAADSFLTLKELAVQGDEIAILPRFVGDGDSRLVRIADLMPDIAVPIWVGHPSDHPVTPKLRQVLLHLEDNLIRQKSVFGEA